MMKRLLVTAVSALVVLAGCGNDTCTSNPAKLADQPLQSCTLAAGTSATIRVPLCSRCNDSAPSCQAEFVGDHFEVQPTVQQCQDQSGCAGTGCNAAAPTASCAIAVPANLAPGTYQLVVVGDGNPVFTTLNIGSGTSCSL